MNQLANFVAYSPLAQVTRDGQESLLDSPGSDPHLPLPKNRMPRLLTRRLNPHFGGWLMGWPLHWTSTTVRSSSSASETELWRSRLDAQLSGLLNEPESP